MNQEIQNITDIIIQSVQPDKIILFGSRALENNSKMSDYDICILKSGLTKKRAITQELYKLLYKTKLAIDIIVETPEKFLELKNIPYMIYREIFNNGKVIYEKE